MENYYYYIQNVGNELKSYPTANINWSLKSGQRIFKLDSNKLFHDQYVKVIKNSKRLNDNMRYTALKFQSLQKTIIELSIRAQNFKDIIRPTHNERKKKQRRISEQIQKIYHCKQQRCGRSYGSESSLRVHIRQKHPSIFVNFYKNSKNNITNQQKDLQNKQ